MHTRVCVLLTRLRPMAILRSRLNESELICGIAEFIYVWVACVEWDECKYVKQTVFNTYSGSTRYLLGTHSAFTIIMIMSHKWRLLVDFLLTIISQMEKNNKKTNNVNMISAQTLVSTAQRKMERKKNENFQHKHRRSFLISFHFPLSLSLSLSLLSSLSHSLCHLIYLFAINLFRLVFGFWVE